MADTQRTWGTALGNLVIGGNQATSVQDLRDMVLTMRSRIGNIHVLAADSASVTIPDTTNYVEVTNPAWTLDSDSLGFDESDGNGRLTYTGAADVFAVALASYSFTTASNNRIIHSRIGKNGTSSAASEIIRKSATGADVGHSSMILFLALSTGDHLSLFVRNEDGADDITVESASLIAVTFPK